MIYYRTATIQADEDSYVGKISQEIYNQFLLGEKQKMIYNEVNFLVESFFMKTIIFANFKKRFFPDFIQCEMTKGTNIYKEGAVLDTMYFIKEGEIEIKLDINIFEIIKLITTLLKRANILHELLEEFEGLKPNSKFKSEMEKKKPFKLCIFGSKEIIGLESFFFKIPIFFNAEVSSERSRLYKMEIKNVVKILNEEKSCVPDLKDLAIKRIEIIIKRLYETYKFKLTLIEKLSIDLNSIKIMKQIKTIESNNIPNLNKTQIIDSEYYKNITNNHLNLSSKKKPDGLLITTLPDAIKSRNSAGRTEDNSINNKIKISNLKNLSVKETPRVLNQVDDIKYKKFNLNLKPKIYDEKRNKH